MFENPTFTLGAVTYTAIGAAVIWAKMGRAKLKAYVLSDIVNRLPLSVKLRSLIEFIIFVTLGCAVGIGVAQPTNARQALTAGIAWTSFFSIPRAIKKSPKQNRFST